MGEAQRKRLDHVVLPRRLPGLALLERYARPGTKASRGDWVFVLGIIAALFAVALIPFLFTVWLLSRFRLF